MNPERYPLLSRTQTPAQLRQLDDDQAATLANELRAFLIESVSRSGGHFGAGLGCIELTVALHFVFNTPYDRVVWDVGHQAYPHKILTGRADRIETIKKRDGLAPFPKRHESEYDTFGVGHSSTSISAALGMAIAAARKGEDRRSIAVIGDGAMTAGMAYEALHHGGDLEPNMLVVLNENQMSISPNVGALTKMLGRIVAGKVYTGVRETGKRMMKDGSRLRDFMSRWEEHLKGMVVPSTLFEELGFNYVGPIDGHDFPLLVRTLRQLKALNGPKLLHIITEKGKGYPLAEKDPVGYHAVGPFDPEKGVVKKAKSGGPSYTEVFGNWICDAAKQNPKVMAITPAMREGSGLVKFAQDYSEQYFDVGIAEQHSVTFAAGLACEGLQPVVAIYSTFLQRAYDQLIHDVAIQNLPVLFAIDRAGLVGPDGQTHAGSFDISFMRCIPNLTLMAPADEQECYTMLNTGLALKAPAAVRYPRGKGPGVTVTGGQETLPVGKAQTRVSGTQVALCAFGTMVAPAAVIAQKHGFTCLNMRFIKPIDEAAIVAAATDHELLVTLEENALQGGAGSAILEVLQAHGLTTPVIQFGLPDQFQDHGTREELLSEAGLDEASLEQAILKHWKKQPRAHQAAQ